MTYHYCLINEMKYLVFQFHLLSFFIEYTSCHQYCVDEVAQQMGTFISIKQKCHHCRHKWKGNSQSFIKDVPAGSILLHTFQWVYSNQVILSFQVSRNGMHYRKNILLLPGKLSCTICHACTEVFTASTLVQI